MDGEGASSQPNGQREAALSTEVAEASVALLAGMLPEGTRVTVDTPFNALGFDSLMATRVWFGLKRAFGVEVPLDLLGRCADARDLGAAVAARRLSGIGEPASGTSVPKAEQPSGAVDGPFALTPVQESYLFGKQTPGDAVGCHLYREFEVEQLDTDRLRTAWQDVINRQEMLRAVVGADGSRSVLPTAGEWEMPVHEAADHAAAVAQVRRRLSHRLYPPGAWPAFTIEVTLDRAGRGTVHLSLDGCLTDGQGLELLLREWSAAYHGALDPRTSVLPAVGACIADLRNQADPPEDLAYWEQRLAGVPAGPDLGWRTPAPPPAGVNCLRRRSMDERLTRSAWQALRTKAAQLEVSPTALVLTVFAETLARGGAAQPFTLVLTRSARPRLPADAAGLVGPFTETTVFPVEATLDRPFDEAVRAVHAALWADLGHGRVCGVTALRTLCRRVPEARGLALPVVFTSLLDASADASASSGFAETLTYASSQTTGVHLDHQMWVRDGGLQIHWDVAEEVFPTGLAETLFASFMNALGAFAVGDQGGTRQPLNELQKAYYVARSTTPRAPWNGCQVYHAFDVEDLDTARLAAAWTRLLATHEVLRRVPDLEGMLAPAVSAPACWRLPVIDLSDDDDLEAALARIRDDMAGRAFPLGRWPGFDLRVTRTADGSARVHVAIDLALLDGRSIHLLLRELFRLYADPDAAPVASGEPGDQAGSAPRQAAAVGYWQRKFADLPGGPAWSYAPADHAGPRVRLAGTFADWAQARSWAEARDLDPDSMLLALLTDALSAEFGGTPFSLPVVRWLPEADAWRPGEYTSLGWVTCEGPIRPVAETAAAYRDELARDAEAAAADGLAELRREVMRRRRHGQVGFPVVYTGLLHLADHPLPDGVRLGPWLTYTPDVTIDCIAAEEADGLHYLWDAAADVFTRAALERAFASFGAALQRLATDGAEVSPGDPVPASWHDTARPVSDTRPLHARIEAQARQRPDAVALRGTWGATRYRELDRDAGRIAVHLTALGVGPEQVVGISVRRCPWMIAAVLGVLKAGGAYLPLDPGLPAARVAGMLRDADARVVLTTACSPHCPAPEGVAVVEVDRLPPADGVPAAPAIDADNTAYVIFTSGSTGAPKGVAVTHRAVANLLAWCQRRFGFGPGDLGLAVTSLSFDLSVFDIFGLLGTGGSLYLADETERMDPALLLDILLRQPVTFWNSAPTTLSQVARLLPSGDSTAGTDDLRLVFLSGDFAPLDLPGELRAVFPGARIVNLGGATEATVWSNAFEVGEIDPDWRSIPYGKPIDNARYYVLDPELSPCPVATEGELFIAGACLARGYVGRPDLTAERFLPDPFAAEPGARMYRTGDRAAYLPDGNLVLHGRLDDQVKVRGFRVEPGEIAHVLRGHPGVKEAVVLARDDHMGERKLVAYVVPEGDPAPSAAELRAHTGRMLPDYMVPNHVAFLGAFPASANGKLDRAALPWPLETASEVAAPSPLQADIAALFAEMLGCTDVDPLADLWDLGATSFTMVQVSNALQRRTGQRIPVATLLTDPTVAGIAARLEELSVKAAPGQDQREPPPEGPGPAPVDILSADAVAAFKAAGWNSRPVRPNEARIALADIGPATEHYAWRASRTDFVEGPLAFADFSRMLGLLRARCTANGSSRHLYPSAGATYAVQVYLHVKPDAVEDLPGGLYHYDPWEHELVRIRDDPAIGRAIHFQYNRETFDRAGLGIFLVGQRRGIEPMYGEQAERFLLLEAGYLGQLLMMGQASCGVGLCPIGDLAFEDLRCELGLGPDHCFLHAFLGGRATHVTRAGNGEGPAFGPALGQPSARTAETEQEPIAIVGLAGRYPQAPDLAAFWRNLETGRDCVTPLPAARHRPDWPNERMWGGFLDGVDCFDPRLFNITPYDAGFMDPQERLFLEVVWEALEDAGYPRARLHDAHGGRVGVFAGAMYQEYPFFGVESALRGAPVAAGNGLAAIANRVSYTLDLAGPSVAVDTMCSTALTCLHLAAESLRRGECEVAVAGGINLNLHPNKYRQLDRLQMGARDHRCRSFGAGGDGFVPGEGVGAVLLKTFSRAVADGDRIQAVIRATAVNHGGKTRGFTVPNPEAQAELLRSALARAGVTPDSIGYLEAHGTGTELGDPIEIDGLVRAFGEAVWAPRACAIGSVKSNIGHLEGAAGIAGLTKVVLMLRHRRFVPSLHCERLNPHIDWAHVPFRVQTEAADWPDGPGPRRAGVSAFGAGGANAHVVVEAHEAAESSAGAPSVPARPELVVLSAADDERLRAVAARLAAFLETDRPDLPDLAYTLQVGREPLRERLAMPAEDTEDLRRRLQRFVDGDETAVLRGRAPTGGPNAGAPVEPSADLHTLGRAWVAGGRVDWAALHRGRPRRIVGLPTYPFNRMHCWLPEAPAPGTGEAIGTGETQAAPVYTKVWRPAEGTPASPLPEGARSVCLYNEASRDVARALADRLGGQRTCLLPVDRLDSEATQGRLSNERDAVELIDLGDLFQPDDDRDGAFARFGLLQGWLTARAGHAARAIHVTRGLLSAPGPAACPAGARMAALLRSLGTEYRGLHARVFDGDLDPAATAAWADLIAGELGRTSSSGEVCSRDGRRLEPALERLTLDQAARLLPDPERSYVVTGGTRGLGALVAQRLVERGARRIAVLGLRPLSSADDPAAREARDNLRRLEDAGARVLLHTGPFTDRAALAAFLEQVRVRLGPIGGIVHCAGAASRGRPAFVHKARGDFEETFAPKIDGLVALAELTSEDSLDFLCVFSSVAGVVPALAAGVADYAAANGCADLLADHLARSTRTPVRAIAWPTWHDTGMGRERPEAGARAGLGSLDDATGLATFERILANQGPSTVVVCPTAGSGVDLETLLSVQLGRSGGAPDRPEASPPRAGDPPAWLRAVFAETLRIPETELDPDIEFADLGVESVMLAELTRKIEAATRKSLDPSVLLEHCTIARLAAHLGAVPVAPTAPVARPKPAPAVDGKVAVIGLGCRFPGAPDPSAFWDNLLAGHCAVGEVPLSRWDIRTLYAAAPAAGRSVGKWGAFLDGIEDFDPEYFGLGPSEALALDPAIRLVLEVAEAGIAEAGYRPDELAGRDVGVYLGARMSDYRARVAAQVPEPGLGGDQNFIAAALAQQYDLRGPNLVVDSACSSSLVAVQLACRALCAGDCDMALAGGVEVLLDETPYLEFSRAGALSPNGRCAAFDESADGFVPGEGCGVVLLKPLDRALVDGDRVHAVIDAVAVANDGRTVGLTTPNPAAQTAVISRALAASGWDAETVGLLEAHGTATTIGDPMELRALRDAFRATTDATGFCALGSVKSNVGHLFSAAGIAGLIKAVMAVEAGELPPTLFCDRPNPRFDFANSPFVPNTRRRPWPSTTTRRVAGVSAFGLGGTNAHAVVSQFDPTLRTGHPEPRSARPAPVFRRRRLWLERAGPPTPAATDPDVPPASILELEFEDDQEACNV